MTYRGTVRQGVVVLEHPLPLADGTAVRVEVLDAGTTTVDPDSAPAFHPVGRWDGPPGEVERLLSEVQQLRDADN